MNKILSEYDSMKHFLNKVRLNESVVSGIINEDATTNANIPTNPGQTTSKTGEKIQFNNINTVGFLSNLTGGELNQENKDAIISSIEDFIKACGLILSIVEIRVFSGRIILFSNTIKNPGIDFVKSITVDTNMDNPKLDFLSANVDVNADYMTLIGNITKSYNDNQVGRQKLVQATQNKF